MGVKGKNVKMHAVRTGKACLPADWLFVDVADVCSKVQDGTHFSPKTGGTDYLYLTSKNIRLGYLDLGSLEWISASQHKAIYRRCDVKKGDLLLTKDGANTGNAAINSLDEEFSLLSSVAFLRFYEIYSTSYFLQQIISANGQRQIQEAMTGNAITRLTLAKIKKLRFPIPVSFIEQTLIAEALGDVDILIETLGQLLAKKRQIRQGAVQELLKGKRRVGAGMPDLASFNDQDIPADWIVKPLGELVTFLDSKRKPVKDVDRAKMKGVIPYFGASGVIDFVNDYLFDDDLILLAEDGENIVSRNCRLAFCISGKAWVNNHAHVLKPNPGVDITYLAEVLESLDYEQYNTGTAQPKLNKKICAAILIPLPPTELEQRTITSVLSGMELEITAIEAKITKARHLKQAMMQQLLTGKIRLI